MEELIEQMKRLLADTFAFYLQAHYYHWNVEGPDFKQYHELFGEIYKETHGAVDQIAEHIRALDAYVPGSFERFSTLTTIRGDNTIQSALGMIRELLEDNGLVMVSLRRAYTAAGQTGEIGLSNFLQDRYDAHTKHQWMLRSTLKVQ